jgi:type IV pilus biogenesis protein CpaD/CtpE
MKLFSKTRLQVLLVVLALPSLQACMFNSEDDAQLAVQDQRYGGSNQHPIVVKNGKAKVAKCGRWTDVTDTEQNLHSPNHGCAVQHNIAAMISKPK